MTVYVDTMRAKFGRMVMCHMVADTEDELHKMAQAIGISRRHFQQVPSGDHYDIRLSKKRQALALGAVEITQRQLGAMCWNRRRRGELGDPATAYELMQADYRADKAATEGKAENG